MKNWKMLVPVMMVFVATVASAGENAPKGPFEANVKRFADGTAVLSSLRFVIAGKKYRILNDTAGGTLCQAFGYELAVNVQTSVGFPLAFNTSGASIEYGPRREDGTITVESFRIMGTNLNAGYASNNDFAFYTSVMCRKSDPNKALAVLNPASESGTASESEAQLKGSTGFDPASMMNTPAPRNGSTAIAL